MTSDDFRALALELPGAVELSHMGHPDFRANGRVFASLNADGSAGMAKLSPELQRTFIGMHQGFKPAAGKWGENGSTLIELAAADASAVAEALEAAFRLVNEKPKK